MIYHRIYSNYFHSMEMLVNHLLRDVTGKDKQTVKTLEKLPIDEALKDEIKVMLQEELVDFIDERGNVANLSRESLPEYPMTILERRWLKTISADPRVRLLDIDWSALDDVDPLYDRNDIVYFDQQNTSDPWTDEKYIRNFRIILDACQKGRQLAVSWINRSGVLDQAVCWPELIEYDRYEDKMRMMASTDDKMIAVVIGRIQTCEVCEHEDNYKTQLHTDRTLPTEGHLYDMADARESMRKEENDTLPVLTIRITDKLNALERTLAIFGHYQKKDFRPITNEQYLLELYLDPFEETDDIIDHILYLGAYIELLGPADIKACLIQRLKDQAVIV